MIYLEIAYAQKDEAKSFGARWDPKEKRWYFPGDVLPEELERFRPANAPEGPVEKIILDVPFSYRDGPGNDCNEVDILVCPCIVQETDVLSRPKTSLPVTGNLAMEIFFGASLAGGLRVPTREAVDGVFCRL